MGKGVIVGVGWGRTGFVKVVVLGQHHAGLSLP